MVPRILVVEDSSANIMALSAILGARGYQLSIAMNGLQAFDALERIRPDLILLDIMMPEMDGLEVCRRLKSSSSWRDIPVIFITSKAETADIVRGFELGAVDYVGKPFSAHELLARVNTHLTLAHLFRENKRLLLNVLPESIADKLRQGDGIIAERSDDITVLFADIVGFTPLSAELEPHQIVELLNRVFSKFDQLVGSYGVEKIKTIGDAYMVAGGLIDEDPDHLAKMAAMSLEMLKGIASVDGRINLRIGMHVGSVVAGVIGRRKFAYDIWGDTVNVASRLESHGSTGKVHVSEDVYARLKGRFEFTSRGAMTLKGLKSMNTFFLEDHT